MKFGILDDYFNLVKFVERFENFLKIKVYMAFDKFMVGFINNKVVGFK